MRNLLQPCYVFGRSLRAALIAALALSPAGVVRADRNTAAESASSASAEADLNTRGLELYKAGKYREAAEAFLGAYAVDHDPNALFNVARCYERLGDATAALQKYESFLSSPDVEPEGRARAERAVQVLREQQTAPVATARVAAKSDSASPVAAAREEPATRTRARRVAVGWTTTGVLAVGAAVGAILAVKSSQELTDTRNAFPGDPGDVDAAAAKATGFAIATDVLGVAAIAMGVVSLCWTVKRPSTGREIKAALGPSQLNVSGSF